MSRRATATRVEPRAVRSIARSRTAGRPRDFGTVSAHVDGSRPGILERMFATSEGTVDQPRERRREARRSELRALCAQQARIAQRVDADRARGRRRRRLARGGLLVERGLARAALPERPPHRGAHHTHERRAALAARARPRARHGRADARPGRRRRRVRDARDRSRARARRGGHGAERDLARRTHARTAGRRGRRGALRTTRAEHDLDARAARARDQRPPAARTGRRVRTGDLDDRQRAARRRHAGGSVPWAGSSRPPTRSSRSPATATARMPACGAARRR